MRLGVYSNKNRKKDKVKPSRMLSSLQPGLVKSTHYSTYLFLIQVDSCNFTHSDVKYSKYDEKIRLNGYNIIARLLTLNRP